MRLFSSLAQIGCIDIESRGTIKTCANQSQALNLQLSDPSPPPTRAFTDPQHTASYASPQSIVHLMLANPIFQFYNARQAQAKGDVHY